MAILEEGERAVRLLNAPANLYLEHLQNLRDLIHELQTMQAGDETGTAPVAGRLGRLMVEILDELLGRRWPVAAVSSVSGDGFETLGRRTFDAMEIVRIYAKQPGKPPDRNAPFTLRRGARVGELAERIHKDIAAHMKFARIWGTSAFEGQTVQRDHVLEEGDVVEIHM